MTDSTYYFLIGAGSMIALAIVFIILKNVMIGVYNKLVIYAIRKENHEFYAALTRYKNDSFLDYHVDLKKLEKRIDELERSAREKTKRKN